MPDGRILDVGPEFALLGVVQGNFGLQHVNAAVGVNYALGGASFIFPPQSGSNTNGITSSSTRKFQFLLSMLHNSHAPLYPYFSN